MFELIESILGVIISLLILIIGYGIMYVDNKNGEVENE